MKQAIIGALDIGGTKMAAILANADGPLVRITQPTVKSGSIRALAEQGLALLDAACERAGVDRAMLDRVGVASCGPFVHLDGMLGIAPPNICGGRSGSPDLPNDWDIIPLEKVLRERFPTVAIENDCVTALVAERTFGAAIDVPDCVYVTWSTGIGFGLCVDGRILRGKQGNAGHAGHMLMSPDSNALCGCGNRGDLEGLISGRNLGNRVGQKTADVFEAAANGERLARTVAEEAAQWFGRGLYNVAATLDTRLFVIGGSVWEHHADWLAPIVREQVGSRLPALTQGVSIVTAALGRLVADVGALALVMPPEWIPRWRETTPWRALA
jgi:glucokinase